jgi:hypothetical protein
LFKGLFLFALFPRISSKSNQIIFQPSLCLELSQPYDCTAKSVFTDHSGHESCARYILSQLTTVASILQFALNRGRHLVIEQCVEAAQSRSLLPHSPSICDLFSTTSHPHFKLKCKFISAERHILRINRPGLHHLKLYDNLPEDGKVFLFDNPDPIHLNLNYSISKSLRLFSFSPNSASFSMLGIPRAFSVNHQSEPLKSFLASNDELSPLRAHRQIVVIEPCESYRSSLFDSLLNYGELHSLSLYWIMLCDKHIPSQSARNQRLNTSRWIHHEDNSTQSHLELAFREIDLILNAGLVIEMQQSEVSLIRHSIGRSTATLSTLIKQPLHSSPIDLIDFHATDIRHGKSLSFAAMQAVFHYFKFVTTKKVRRRLLVLLLLVSIVLCICGTLSLKRGDCRKKPELAHSEDLLKRL